ncbi:TetR/AcrR family transcriptional regulator [Umezawaea sp.]|uniref:TetR/AcrR family transcriptional regulator n=1 Tax=Umezawaea sp. TaxID=1955258 RepID=UPI002ED12807
MADERTSAGDPARTLQLLWREPAAVPRRGPRQGLTVDAVVEAATSLADTSGLEALTMRKVASALGVVAMTLYTYVPGKAELLDLMLDAAYGRMSRTSTEGRPWRERVTAVAAENRRLFETHPWAASVSTVRPLLGPGQMGKYEHELAALDGLGLSDVEVDAALTHLLSFVQAWARSAADSVAAAAESSLSEAEWWAVNAPLLDRVLDPAVYPLATRVGSAAGAEHGAAYSPEFAYGFGLARVLDGLAALVERA